MLAAALFSPLFSLPCFAATNQPVPKLSLAYAPVAAASDSLSLTVRVEIAPGWAINSAAPLEDFLVPTRLDVTAKDVEFSAPVFPAPLLERSEAMGGNVSLYKGAFDILVPGRFKIKGGLRAEKTAPVTRVVLHYQSCSGGMCYPPKTAEADWGGAQVTKGLPDGK